MQEIPTKVLILLIMTTFMLICEISIASNNILNNYPSLFLL